MSISKSERFKGIKTHQTQEGGKHDREIGRVVMPVPAAAATAVEEAPVEAPEAAIPVTGVAETEVIREPVFQPKIVEAKYQPEVIKREDVDSMTAGLQRLMEYLPEDVSQLIGEYCKSTDTPLWMAIGGYVMRSREDGTLMAPVVMPEWQDMIPASSLRACGTCGDPLKPVVWSQRFCCNSCYFGNVGKNGHSENCALVKTEAA